MFAIVTKEEFVDVLCTRINCNLSEGYFVKLKPRVPQPT